MEGWSDTNIGDFCDTGEVQLQTGPFGTQLHAHDYRNHGVPVVPTEAIEEGRINHGVLPRISQAKAEELSRHRLIENDILFARRGVQATGRTAIVRASEQGFICGTGAIRLRVHHECKRLDAKFLSCLLGSKEVIAWFKFHAIGATMPNLNEGIIRSFPFKLPSMSEQRAIAATLGALDDKIELNRRMNETLEAMARAIFKDWFVDFGPTRAKIEGRAPYLAPEVWSLFPDRLDEEGKPEGWIASTIGKYMLNFDAKRIPLSAGERAKRQGSIPYHGATSVMDHIDGYLFDGTYLLIGEDGSVMKEGGQAFTQYVWGKFWVNNHAHVLQGRGSISTEQLLLYFDHENVAPFVTGAVQLKLSQGRMNSMPFVFAGDVICESFRKAVDPFFQRIRSNSDENRYLSAMRDMLLPKLMSGELSIKEAEQELENIA